MDSWLPGATGVGRRFSVFAVDDRQPAVTHHATEDCRPDAADYRGRKEAAVRTRGCATVDDRLFQGGRESSDRSGARSTTSTTASPALDGHGDGALHAVS